jgi:hypothetical protein
MILVDNKLVSFDIFLKKFVCRLDKCKGMCCVEGNYGAPLEEDEVVLLQAHLDDIRPYMTEAGISVLITKGLTDIDPEGMTVTQCVRSAECIFIYREGDVVKCAIEKAYEEGRINFQKPVSCHLYPIRVEKLKHYLALNYHKWKICAPACKYGEETDTALYVFLKEPLVRKFGQEWYDELVRIAHDVDWDEIPG